jgi:hypothetical protein
VKISKKLVYFLCNHLLSNWNNLISYYKTSKISFNPIRHINSNNLNTIISVFLYFAPMELLILLTFVNCYKYSATLWLNLVLTESFETPLKCNLYSYKYSATLWLNLVLTESFGTPLKFNLYSTDE